MAGGVGIRAILRKPVYYAAVCRVIRGNTSIMSVELNALFPANVLKRHGKTPGLFFVDVSSMIQKHGENSGVVLRNSRLH